MPDAPAWTSIDESPLPAESLIVVLFQGADPALVFTGHSSTGGSPPLFSYQSGHRYPPSQVQQVTHWMALPEIPQGA